MLYQETPNSGESTNNWYKLNTQFCNILPMNARKNAPQLFKPNPNPAPIPVLLKLANIKEAKGNGPNASISFSREYIRPAENVNALKTTFLSDALNSVFCEAF